jgi:hypothetical protein
MIEARGEDWNGQEGTGWDGSGKDRTGEAKGKGAMRRWTAPGRKARR